MNLPVAIDTSMAFLRARDASDKVRLNLAQLSALCTPSSDDARLGEARSARTVVLRGALLSFFKLFDEVRYPFDHAEEDLSVSRYLAPAPLGRSVAEVAQAAHNAIGLADSLQSRVLAHLASIAEHVESAVFSLEPLPQPELEAVEPQQDSAAGAH